MRRIYSLFILWLSVLTISAQMADPVHFTSQLKELGSDEAEIIFSAKIDAGWHVYSTDLSGGPIPATFNKVKMEGVETVGKLKPRGNEQKTFDKLFGMDVRYFEHTATFVQKVKFTKEKYVIDCYLEYGVCNDEMCMPPSEVAFKKEGKRPTPDPSLLMEGKEDNVKTDTVARVVLAENTDSINNTACTDSTLWVPTPLPQQGAEEGGSLLAIFIAGLLGGFIALLTPCVWPIIPMTVSFFLKRNKGRAKAIREALTYGLSIIIIYVALGLLITLLFGANALNAMSTNAWFNIFFALLLIIFAASFFGAFELTLPSSWSNKIDQKSDRTTGILSIFLMAFTLVLVSFSCTGPIIGFLLVAISTQGNILGPTFGMLGFSIGLAIPFALFALFPSLLKSTPKSGSWMNTIKVVLGFIELAFALKFLSVADLAYGWRLLDREVFLAIWIALFGLLGAYLMGWLRFPHDEPEHRTNVPQFFLGLLSFAFTIYMIPGLWGAPLKAISAFTPPMYTQDYKIIQTTVVEAPFKDYEQGMAFAKEQHKPVIIDFTGFGCVNCRKMEAAVWTDEEVARRLTQDYVLISLYVDDKTPLAQPVEVEINGQKRTLRTVGDKWSYLQATKFGANTQPFYVLLDPQGTPLAPSRSYDEDIQEYINWLDAGLTKYKP
ncbi:protein-disulfide reductase DsbD [Prevotella sp. tf2-5]|uniref:protein-disulfide reductase DsbD family protein n=1 Tax=Prevotella sp. tf2-5 TaxID=1761889 RepID=UPI000B85DEC5|nr:cytochrome c biogenesis protein CcdA [Prevotella sp. tf2-5]